MTRAQELQEIIDAHTRERHTLAMNIIMDIHDLCRKFDAPIDIVDCPLLYDNDNDYSMEYWYEAFLIDNETFVIHIRDHGDHKNTEECLLINLPVEDLINIEEFLKCRVSEM